MDRFINAVKRHAAAMDAGQPQPRWGIVASVNPARAIAKVRLQPEDVLTGWLPITAPAASNGWGVITLPTPGDMVQLVPEGGGGSDYVIVGAAYNDTAPPAKPANAIGSGGTLSAGAVQVAPGEICLISKAGAVVRLCADGSIYLRGPVNIDGTLRVNGDVFDRHGSLDRLRGHYNAHAHGGVATGIGSTATTDTPDPE